MKKPTRKQLSDFETIKAELIEKDMYVGTIEYGADDEWLGMIYAKNLTYTIPEQQKQFAKCVFNGEKRL